MVAFVSIKCYMLKASTLNPGQSGRVGISNFHADQIDHAGNWCTRCLLY